MTNTMGSKSDIAVAQNDIKTIKDSLVKIEKILSDLDERYVTKEEFWPVRAIVYGGAGIVLVGILTIILNMVTKG